MNPEATVWSVRCPAESSGHAAAPGHLPTLGTGMLGGAPPALSAHQPTTFFNSEVPVLGPGTMHDSTWNRVSDPSRTSSGGMGGMVAAAAAAGGVSHTSIATCWQAGASVDTGVRGGGGGGGGGGGTAHASGGWVMGSCEPLPQGSSGAGAGGGGGGSSRGRPGRKPHPRPEDLQAQVDALSAQFGRLNAENQFLKSKLKALEAVLPWRETSVNFLASLKASSSANSAHASAISNGAAAAPRQSASGVLGGTATGCGAGPAAPTQAVSAGAYAPTAAAAALAMHGAVGVTPLVPRQGGGHAAQPVAAAAGAGAAASGPQPHHPRQHAHQTPLVVALCPGPGDDEVPDISPADAEELKRVGVPEFLQFWKHFSLQVGLLLVGAEAAGPGSAKAIRLERYLERLTLYLDQVLRLSPLCWNQSMNVNVETGQRERPTDDYWTAVCKFANLSRQQMEEIEHLAAALDQAVAPVVQERAVLTAQLSSQLRNTTATAASLVSGPTALLDATAALTEVDELAAQLERNVLREQQSHWDVTDFLWLSTLSPVQGARVLGASYPYVPDALAIMHACRQLLRAGALAS